MDEATAHRIGGWIVRHRPEIVDLTGGAPEMSEFFRYFVETARAAGAEVIDRNNLTIIEAEGYGWLPRLKKGKYGRISLLAAGAHEFEALGDSLEELLRALAEDR